MCKRHSISLSFRFGMALGVGLFLLLSSFTWRSYLSYSTPQQIVQADGGLIYVLASNGLYAYNTKDQSVRTFDKVNGLSDCNISYIAYNKVSHRLLIVYANQNIDLMDRSGEVTNLSAYHNTTMTADKTVNSIYLSGRYAYLATGFGIVKLNTAAVEVSDTYNLGFSVDYVYIRSNVFFAASAKQGVYSAQLTANLADRKNWHRVGNYVAPTPIPEVRAITTSVSCVSTRESSTLAVVMVHLSGRERYKYWPETRGKSMKTRRKSNRKPG